MNEELLKRRVWQAAWLVGIFLSLFLIVVSIKEIRETGYVGKDLSMDNTITVTGTGDAVAMPDIATFSFGVDETAKAVEDAQTAASTKINAAIKALSDAGVADKDIQTTSYNINPQYQYTSGICQPDGQICQPGKQVLTGYEVTENIEVKVRDLTKAGSLFATIGSIGVENVNGLTFSIDKPDAVEAQARSLAIDDAKSKAQALASQLGVSLGDITNFNDSTNQPVYPIMMSAVSNGMAVPAAAPAPEIPTGQQKITSNVSITYEIR